MSLLEDRLLKIVELKEKGLDEVAIAKEMGIRVGMVSQYVATTCEQIESARAGGINELNEIARGVGISPIALQIFAQIYVASADENPILTYKKVSLAGQRALDYMNSCPRTSYSFQQLVRFYETYEKLHRKGKEVSLQSLAKKSGIADYAHAAERLLGAIGLRRITKRKHLPLAKWKKDALGRIARADSKFSCCDIGAFLSMDGNHARVHLHKHGWKATGGAGIREVRSRWKGERPLTYALASEVYEASDFGYGVEDTAGLVGRGCAERARSKRRSFYRNQEGLERVVSWQKIRRTLFDF